MPVLHLPQLVGLALGVALILWPLAPDLPATSTQLPLFKYFLLVLPAPLYLLFVTVVVTGSSTLRPRFMCFHCGKRRCKSLRNAKKKCCRKCTGKGSH